MYRLLPEDQVIRAIRNLMGETYISNKGGIDET